MRILLVEDSRRQVKYLSQGLRGSGYAVDSADNGEDGLWLAESGQYVVIILDLMLPKLDGMSLLERLRNQGCESQILILSAKDAVDDRILGLEKGADDYLGKPFSFLELLARIRSLVRRRYQVKSPTLSIGDLTIDTARRQVLRKDELIPLPPREYALLEFLAFRRGQVLSRTEIESHIYDDRVEPTSNVVDSAVYALRKRIDAPGKPSIIRTRRGMGYGLFAQES